MSAPTVNGLEVVGVPSELLEGALQDAVSLCIRELLLSDGGDAAWGVFVAEVRGIDRVAICAQGTRYGVHASLAMGSVNHMARTAADWPADRRNELLGELRKAVGR